MASNTGENNFSIKWFLAFAFFSILLSMGFFWESLDNDFSSLSGDQINILTICIKLDDPEILVGDLIVGNPKNIDYYIPAFVNLVRFLSLPDHDYLSGLRILLFFTTFIFMLGWWLLFSVWGDSLTATIFAFLVRGIMWPPGNEVWGISGLWTMLPRTLFLALIPWALWVWIYFHRHQRGWLFSSLLLGLLVNVHPISGLGLCLSVLLAEFYWRWTELKNPKLLWGHIIKGGVIMIAGMTPFIWSFSSTLGALPSVDPVEFSQAQRMRINPIFLHPELYLLKWGKPQWLLLLFGPWIAYLVLLRQNHLSNYKTLIRAIAVLTIGLVLSSLLPQFLERFLKLFDININVAFQLIRIGKYVILPSFLLASLFSAQAFKFVKKNLPYSRVLALTLLTLVFTISFFARSPIFDNVPVFSDDIIRSLWPGWFVNQRKDHELFMAMEWIKGNTSINDKFVGPREIRVGGPRPVIHEFAGAGMLIEGNPHQFVATAKRERIFRSLEVLSPQDLAKTLAGWGADFWMTKIISPEVPLVYSNSLWKIYDVRSYQ